MPSVTCLDPQHSSDSSRSHWRDQLRNAVSNVHELLDILELPEDGVAIDDDSHFRLKVPHAYIDLMHKQDPRDPLLLQVLATLEERDGEGLTDPVGDLDAMLSQGLLKKYNSRALMITTGACAIHCRYCFRRHYPYAEAGCNNSVLDQNIQSLMDDPTIEEVILSGGDPLVLDDDRLASIIDRLRDIPHLRYLRLHSRLPLVLPDRVTDGLCNLLANSGLRTTMVIHANHANEIGEPQQRALHRLHQAGVSLLNQSVLLKGINDDSDTLSELSHALYQHRVTPYYLHMLDPVKGAMHFEVEEIEAKSILRQMLASLPGYLVPKLVREIPNSPSKTTISPY